MIDIQKNTLKNIVFSIVIGFDTGHTMTSILVIADDQYMTIE